MALRMRQGAVIGCKRMIDGAFGKAAGTAPCRARPQEKREMDTMHKHAEPSREGKFVYDSVQDAQTLMKYLQAIKEGFESGSITFSRKDLDFTLSPSGLIGFFVEAKAKEGRMKLTLKFSWRESEETLDKDVDALEISI